LTSPQTPHSSLGRRDVTGSEDDTSASSESESETPPWWHAAFEDDQPAEGVGSAAQEAVKLAAAVASWANDSGVADILKLVVEQAGDTLRGAAATASATAASATKTGATDGNTTSSARDSESHEAGTCEVCPICQGVEVLRTVSPETASGIADAMALVTGALRQAMETVTTDQNASPTESEPASGVQHIKID